MPPMGQEGPQEGKLFLLLFILEKILKIFFSEIIGSVKLKLT
jgi:hypothetical protein